MTLLSPDVDERTTTRSDTPWVTVVWDDPVNLMSYVTYVFQSYFGFGRAKAERLMHQVNDDGRAIVATGAREAMEAHAEAMHGYGLQATVDRAPTP
ncbi:MULTISPECIES: ATP-dependent Clp protease adapter ClpS [Curtobacterium]|uniref:ATP-dependent Clp protease adapter ClpS n=1 Tax=Curtobacterium flaccumfaciens TaxID=2035 RepID=UPI003105AC77